MKTMNILLLSIGFVITGLTLFLVYYGAFSKIEFAVQEEGGEIFVYESYTGSYKQSGVVMDRVYNTLRDSFSVETYKGMGKYYDNPKKVEASKLRSDLGCVLEDKDFACIPKIEEHLSVTVIPKQTYIVAEFPYKGKISVILGILKVYPTLAKYIAQNSYTEDGAVIEMYDILNKLIRYRKEL